MASEGSRIDKLETEVRQLREDLASDISAIRSDTRQILDAQLRHDPARAASEREAMREEIREIQLWRARQTGARPFLSALLGALAALITAAGAVASAIAAGLIKLKGG